jgi:uncharacterized protein with gpF-like domain
MATNPDQIQQQEAERRRQEAEAAAIALLLLGRRRYDLPSLIAARKIRPRPFRRISPSGVMAGDLAAPYLSIARTWEQEAPELLRAYEQASSSRTPSVLHRAIEAAAARAAFRASQSARQMRGAIARIEAWHRAQWLSRVKASTGLDVAMFTTAADVAPEVDTAVAWNELLADDVNAQTKQRIVTALLAAAAVNAPATIAARKAREVEQQRSAKAGEGDPEALAHETPNTVPPSVEEQIADAVAKAKTRARGIGTDQAEKTSASLTRARRQSAGVTTWRWRHYDAQPHPRPEHIRRDGRIYSDANPPPTLPSEEPFCKCWSETVL